MIWTCLSIGDLSPLCPLSLKDAIYLTVFKEELDRIECNRHLAIEDIRYLVAHNGFTALDQQSINNMPSKQYELAEGFRKLKGL